MESKFIFALPTDFFGSPEWTTKQWRFRVKGSFWPLLKKTQILIHKYLFDRINVPVAKIKRPDCPEKYPVSRISGAKKKHLLFKRASAPAQNGGYGSECTVPIDPSRYRYLLIFKFRTDLWEDSCSWVRQLCQDCGRNSRAERSCTLAGGSCIQ